MRLLIYLKTQLSNTWHWVRGRKWIGFLLSVKIISFNSIKHPAIFYGYKMIWFARFYSVKRELFWHGEWNQAGRDQFILPFLRGRLIVCSKLELEIYKKKGLLGKNQSIRKLTNISL